MKINNKRTNNFIENIISICDMAWICTFLQRTNGHRKKKKKSNRLYLLKLYNTYKQIIDCSSFQFIRKINSKAPNKNTNTNTETDTYIAHCISEIISKRILIHAHRISILNKK